MSLQEDLKPWGQWLHTLYTEWIHGRYPSDDLDTPRGHLRLLDSLGGRFLEAAFFFAVALKTSEPLPAVLVLLIGIVYFLSRHSVAIELDIADKLFPAGRLPKAYSGKRDAATITLTVLAFFCLYALLAAVSSSIRLVSFFMLVISCIDYSTRWRIRKQVDEYFRDDSYAPHPDSEQCQLILARRKVVENFLHNRPHLLKEGLRIAGCATAFIIAVRGHWLGQLLAEQQAYLCLIATLVVNEIVTWGWRHERDLQMRTVDGRNTGPRVPFSFPTWSASVLIVVISGLQSWSEGNHVSGPVTMGFLNHGGMWSDLLLLPLANAVIVPRFPRLTGRRIPVLCALLVGALIVTAIAHQQWASMGRAMNVTDHVFPHHGNDVWYKDLSRAGCLHVAYMSVELTLLLAFALSTMPQSTVVFVTALLTLHVIVGQLGPAWYTTRTVLSGRVLVPTVLSVLLVWALGFLKMRCGQTVASERS